MKWILLSCIAVSHVTLTASTAKSEVLEIGELDAWKIAALMVNGGREREKVLGWVRYTSNYSKHNEFDLRRRNKEFQEHFDKLISDTPFPSGLVLNEASIAWHRYDFDNSLVALTGANLIEYNGPERFDRNIKTYVAFDFDALKGVGGEFINYNSCRGPRGWNQEKYSGLHFDISKSGCYFLKAQPDEAEKIMKLANADRLRSTVECGQFKEFRAFFSSSINGMSCEVVKLSIWDQNEPNEPLKVWQK